MPSDRFNAFVPTFILEEECDWPRDKSGQYSNDLDDPGGETKFGIDVRGYRAMHPGQSINIKSLTVDQAINIYWMDYWLRPGVESHPFPLGEVFCNSKVNGGHPDIWINQCGGDAGKFLDFQRQYYRDLCAYWSKKGKHDPYKYLSDWLGRCDRLAKFLNL